MCEERERKTSASALGFLFGELERERAHFEELSGKLRARSGFSERCPTLPTSTFDSISLHNMCFAVEGKDEESEDDENGDGKEIEEEDDDDEKESKEVLLGDAVDKGNT